MDIYFSFMIGKYPTLNSTSFVIKNNTYLNPSSIRPTPRRTQTQIFGFKPKKSCFRLKLKPKFGFVFSWPKFLGASRIFKKATGRRVRVVGDKWASHGRGPQLSNRPIEFKSSHNQQSRLNVFLLLQSFDLTVHICFF